MATLASCSCWSAISIFRLWWIRDVTLDLIFETQARETQWQSLVNFSWSRLNKNDHTPIKFLLSTCILLVAKKVNDKSQMPTRHIPVRSEQNQQNCQAAGPVTSFNLKAVQQRQFPSGKSSAATDLIKSSGVGTTTAVKLAMKETQFGCYRCAGYPNLRRKLRSSCGTDNTPVIS